MTNHERVKLAFNDVKAPKGFANNVLNKQGNISTINTQRTGSRRTSKVFVIAATVCLALGLTVTAMATNFFGLRNLELPRPAPGDQFLGIPITEEMFDDPDYSWLLGQDFSMQGFEGSPEHAAAVEWREFKYGYDVDGVLREAVGNTWGDVPWEYQYYGAYTMEMVEKIREIIERHGLILIGNIIDTRTPEEFQELIAYGPLFTDDSVEFNGFMYESGTIRIEGQYGDIGLYMRSSRRGVFDWVTMGIGDMASVTEWTYENVFGKQLLLIQDIHSSTIILDTETAFNVLSLHAGTEGSPWQDVQLPPFTAQDLENFADMVDFRQLRTELPVSELIADFEAQRNVMDVAVSSLIGGWQLLAFDHGSSLLPMWNADYRVHFTINDDRSFRLWHGEGIDDPQSWFIEGEIVPAEDNVYKAIALRMLRNPFDIDLSANDIFEMPLQYDSDTGYLRLVLSSEIDSGGMLIFGRTTDSDFTPIPTPEPIPQSVGN